MSHGMGVLLSFIMFMPLCILMALLWWCANPYATFVLLQRLVRGPTEPSHWGDYGTFHMRTGDHVKAEECFQHAVSIQPAHLPRYAAAPALSLSLCPLVSLSLSTLLLLFR